MECSVSTPIDPASSVAPLDGAVKVNVRLSNGSVDSGGSPIVTQVGATREFQCDFRHDVRQCDYGLQRPRLRGQRSFVVTNHGHRYDIIDLVFVPYYVVPPPRRRKIRW